MLFSRPVATTPGGQVLFSIKATLGVGALVYWTQQSTPLLALLRGVVLAPVACVIALQPTLGTTVELAAHIVTSAILSACINCAVVIAINPSRFAAVASLTAVAFCLSFLDLPPVVKRFATATVSIALVSWAEQGGLSAAACLGLSGSVAVGAAFSVIAAALPLPFVSTAADNARLLIAAAAGDLAGALEAVVRDAQLRRRQHGRMQPMASTHAFRVALRAAEAAEYPAESERLLARAQRHATALSELLRVAQWEPCSRRLRHASPAVVELVGRLRIALCAAVLAAKLDAGLPTQEATTRMAAAARELRGAIVSFDEGRQARRPAGSDDLAPVASPTVSRVSMQSDSGRGRRSIEPADLIVDAATNLSRCLRAGLEQHLSIQSGEGSATAAASRPSSFCSSAWKSPQCRRLSPRAICCDATRWHRAARVAVGILASTLLGLQVDPIVGMNPFWAPVTVAFIAAGPESGALRNSSQRLVGTLLGAAFGLLANLLLPSSSAPGGAVLVSVALGVFAGALHMYRQRGAAAYWATVAAFTAPMIAVISDGNDVLSRQVALARIEQTCVGIAAYVVVCACLLPASPRTAARSAAASALLQLRDAVTALAPSPQLCPPVASLGAAAAAASFPTRLAVLLDEAESEPQWWREPLPHMRQHYAELAQAVADVSTALAVVKAEAAFTRQLPAPLPCEVSSTEVSESAGASALASPDSSHESVPIAVDPSSAPCVAEDAGHAEPWARVLLKRAAAVLQATAGVLAAPRSSPLDSCQWARRRGASGGCCCCYFSWRERPPPDTPAAGAVSALLLDSAVGALVDATVEASAASPPLPPRLDECASVPGCPGPLASEEPSVLPLRVAAVHALALAVVRAARASKVAAQV